MIFHWILSNTDDAWTYSNSRARPCYLYPPCPTEYRECFSGLRFHWTCSVPYRPRQNKGDEEDPTDFSTNLNSYPPEAYRSRFRPPSMMLRSAHSGPPNFPMSGKQDLGSLRSPPMSSECWHSVSSSLPLRFGRTSRRDQALRNWLLVSRNHHMIVVRLVSSQLSRVQRRMSRFGIPESR